MIRLVFVLLTVSCTVTPKLIIEDGYYWRNYYHKIPGDALPCGMDNTGAPIYAGQTIHRENIISGKIYSNNSDLHYEYEPPNRSDKNIKILCSLFPLKFEWIWTNPSEINKLTNKALVVGGFQPKYFSYIGRLYVGDETIFVK